MDRRAFLGRCGATLAAGIGMAGCIGGRTSTAAEQTQPAAERTQPAAVDGSFRAARAAAGTTVDDFESAGDEWRARAGSVALAEGGPDGSRHCLRLRAAPGDRQALARRTFASPRSFDGRALSLAVRWLRSGSRFAVVRLTLRDGDGGAVRFAQGVDTKHVAGWHRVDLGVESVVGDPALSEVVAVDVSTWPGGDAAALLVDEIRTVPSTGDGAAVLCFDDVRESAYSVAAPILRDHGFVGVGGVITEAVGRERHLDLEQMADLAGRGWEFCSHPQYADRPLTAMSTGELRSVLGRYRRWLRDHGFAEGAETIIYPFGLLNDDALQVVAEYHRLGMLAHGQPAYGPAVTAPLLCGRVAGTELDRVHAAIDHAAAFDAVVPIMYHGVGTADGIGEEAFAATVQRLDDAGLSTITTAEWRSRMAGGD